MEYKNILVKKADLTGWIIINRPEKLNVLGRAALAELRDAFGGLDRTLPDGLALEAEYFGRACLTEDQREGIKAFLEKRRPMFNGR